MDARAFACGAHAAVGQLYADGPYSDHLEEVVVEAVRLCVTVGGDFQMMSVVTEAAWLHDVLEDTSITAASLIASGFSDAVVAAVQFCTDEEGSSRKMRKALTYDRVKRSPDEAGRIVKWADRICNLRRCAKDNPEKLKMYRAEARAFWEAYMPSSFSVAWDSVLAEYWRLVEDS